MDDDDFRALIDLLERELRAIGAADIADERHYVQRETEDSEARLLDPQKRLIEMLLAFERKLATEDRATFHIALDRMRQALDSDSPQGALLERAREDDRESVFVDLSGAPELSELRHDTRLLVDRLRESPLTPRSPA